MSQTNNSSERGFWQKTKETGVKTLAAGTIATIGLLGLSACGDNAEAKPKPTETEQVTETPTKTPEPTPTETEVSVSKVEKFRDNWNLNTEALTNLGSMQPGQEGYDKLLSQVCTEFFANNPLRTPVQAPERLDSVDVVEARFEARQEMLREFQSDNFRNSRGEDIVSYEVYQGVEYCITNGIQARGSSPSDYFKELNIDDAPLPSVTTTEKEYSIKDTGGTKYDRTAYVTVSVGQKAPEDLWRRFMWSDDIGDWYLAAEQAENPYNLGWQ
jgi:hypothetical protein